MLPNQTDPETDATEIEARRLAVSAQAPPWHLVGAVLLLLDLFCECLRCDPGSGRGDVDKAPVRESVEGRGRLAGVGALGPSPEGLWPGEASVLFSGMGIVSNGARTKPQGCCEAHTGALCPIGAHGGGPGSGPGGNREVGALGRLSRLVGRCGRGGGSKESRRGSGPPVPSLSRVGPARKAAGGSGGSGGPGRRGSAYLGHLVDSAVGLAALQQLGRQITVLSIQLLEDKRSRVAQARPSPRSLPPRPAPGRLNRGQDEDPLWAWASGSGLQKEGPGSALELLVHRGAPCQAVLPLTRVGTTHGMGACGRRRAPQGSLKSKRPQVWTQGLLALGLLSPPKGNLAERAGLSEGG